MRNSVTLLGTYGGDETHALSAWTSTKRDLTDEKRARIPALLKMLAENGHHTPFEKSSLHFLVRTDVATHIHILKHRIGVSVNGESARYKELRAASFYIPEDWPDHLRDQFVRDTEMLYEKYRYYLSALEVEGFSRSRAKESARFILPYANQTWADVMFNFRSFMHFQGLRNEEHAQMEVRSIAQEMLELVRETHLFDASLSAFGW